MNKFMIDNSICFIAPFISPLLYKGQKGTCGGAERQLFFVGRELAKKQWQVSYITMRPQFLKDEEGKIRNYDAWFSVYDASFAYLGGNKARMIFDWFTLWAAMNKANARYYVLKVPTHLLLPMHIFCRLKNRKLIFWSQMDYDAYPAKRFGMNRLASKLQDYGMKRADLIVVQNAVQKKGFLETFNLDSRLISSMAASLEDNKGPLGASVDLLWVGNSTKKKQQEVFFELARLLPDKKCAIALHKSDIARFRQAETQAKNFANVLFLGSLNPYECEQWFSRARVYINTSISEGFPNTFLQAWMNGIPVISLVIDPNSGLRNNTLGGVVFGSTDEMDDLDHGVFARAMLPLVKKYLDSPSLRDQVAVCAKKYIDDHHASAKVITRFCDVLKDL